MNVVPVMMSLLADKNVKVVTPALRTIGNFLAGDDKPTQICLNNGVLFHLMNLLNSNNPSIVKEALWCLSNITAGNEEQIQVEV